jgi:hypothetical protein
MLSCKHDGMQACKLACEVDTFRHSASVERRSHINREAG